MYENVRAREYVQKRTRRQCDALQPTMMPSVQYTMTGLRDCLRVTVLSAKEIHEWQPDQLQSGPEAPANARRAAHAELVALGLAGDGQQMGQRWSAGCIALEITQRCNLDCTACYLSEHSEAVRDIPLTELFRRIDLIAAHFGKSTDIQITGGDPTLRKLNELEAIVGYAASVGLRPTLMTNGIKASPELLRRLANAGLVDVAFHVDMTQQRKGYSSEAELNAIRLTYLQRARCAGLSVMFNTTVYAGNFAELPVLATFFKRHAKSIRTASFQLQADTGRGVLTERAAIITQRTVIQSLELGVGSKIGFGVSDIGHPECTVYALGAVVAGRYVNLLQDANFVHAFQRATKDIEFNRGAAAATLRRIFLRVLSRPRLALAAVGWMARLVLPNTSALIRAGGRVDSLSFVIHEFMDASCLECDRIRACAFKVMTAAGPISMCLHNAKRDEFILQPIPVSTDGEFWQPLTGQIHAAEVHFIPDVDSHPHKRLKGRARARAAADRRRGRGHASRPKTGPETTQVAETPIQRA